MYGRTVETPRWQQAYDKDYRYSGEVNRALPAPPLIKPLLQWGQNSIHTEINGVLVNWYDGAKGHYMGPHIDDIRDLVPETPIVTISFGQPRIFRLSRAGVRYDIVADPASVIVLPWGTNLAWKHAVPRFKRFQERRVSVTLRAYRQ
jgi:alkylated DNA repair dioxygenase AlkB